MESEDRQEKETLMFSSLCGDDVDEESQGSPSVPWMDVQGPLTGCWGSLDRVCDASLFRCVDVNWTNDRSASFVALFSTCKHLEMLILSTSDKNAPSKFMIN